MIVIVGESASGKSSLQKSFVLQHPEYKALVSYTTRPPRKGEVDGVDYHYISEEEFEKLEKEGFFAESATYRNWHYGMAKADCQSDKCVAVLTPTGMRNLLRQGYNITSVYIKVDRRSRLISILKRGDDIEEAYRRSLSDVGQFDGIEEEVDCVLDNAGYRFTKLEMLDNLEKMIF